MGFNRGYELKKRKRSKLRAIFAVLVIGLALVVLSIESLISRRINPAAITRHAIEVCEGAEQDVGVRSSLESPGDIRLNYGSWIKQTRAFGEGYVKVSAGAEAYILDGWGKPLQIMCKTNLQNRAMISASLLSKTNRILIWSSGPNGSNEFGTGDDVFLQPLRKTK